MFELKYVNNKGETSNRIKPLLHNPVIVNQLVLGMYKTFRFAPCIETFYDGVRRVSPPVQPKIITRDLSKTKKDYGKGLEEHLWGCVQKYLDCEKIGVYISGGIDSSTLVALLRLQSKDLEIKTFSVGFEEDDSELREARLIADHYFTDHHEAMISYDQLLHDFPEMIRLNEEPKRALWGYYLARTAKGKVDTVLSGLPMDELMGGYTFRYKRLLENATARMSPEEKVLAYLQASNPRDFEHKRFNDVPYYWLFESFFATDFPSFLEQAWIADFNLKMVFEFMPMDMKFHDFFKLNLELPYLNPYLVNYAFSIPPEYKYDLVRNEGKLVLKEVVKNILPRWVLEKVKRGYAVDSLEIFPKVKEYVESLEPLRSVEEGYYSGRELEEWKHGGVRHYVYANKLWDLLAFELWLKEMV